MNTINIQLPNFRTKYISGVDAEIRTLTYADGGGLCVQIVNADTEANRNADLWRGEVICTASVNVPKRPNLPNAFWLKSYSENEGLEEALLAAGAIKATGRTAPLTYNSVREYVLVREGDEPQEKPDTLSSLGREIMDLISELDSIVNDLDDAIRYEDENDEPQDYKHFVDELDLHTGTIQAIRDKFAKLVKYNN